MDYSSVLPYLIITGKKLNELTAEELWNFGIDPSETGGLGAETGPNNGLSLGDIFDPIERDDWARQDQIERQKIADMLRGNDNPATQPGNGGSSWTDILLDAISGLPPFGGGSDDQTPDDQTPTYTADVTETLPQDQRNTPNGNVGNGRGRGGTIGVTGYPPIGGEDDWSLGPIQVPDNGTPTFEGGITETLNPPAAPVMPIPDDGGHPSSGGGTIGGPAVPPGGGKVDLGSILSGIGKIPGVSKDILKLLGIDDGDGFPDKDNDGVNDDTGAPIYSGGTAIALPSSNTNTNTATTGPSTSTSTASGGAGGVGGSGGGGGNATVNFQPPAQSGLSFEELTKLITTLGLGATVGGFANTEEARTQKSSGTNNNSVTTTSKRDLQPFQQELISPLTQQIMQQMQDPTKSLEPIRAAGYGQINKNYQNAAKNIASKTMAYGGDASGKLGKAIRTSEQARYGDLGAFEGTLAGLGVQRQDRATDQASSLLAQNFGDTSHSDVASSHDDKTIYPGSVLAGAGAGAGSALQTLVLLNELAKGGKSSTGVMY